jgi:hypothetical protein
MQINNKSHVFAATLLAVPMLLSGFAPAQAMAAELTVTVVLPDEQSQPLIIRYEGWIDDDGFAAGTFVFVNTAAGDGPIVGTFTGVLDPDGILTLDIQTAWLRDNPNAPILIAVLQVVVDTDTDFVEAFTYDGSSWRTGRGWARIRE